MVRLGILLCLGASLATATPVPQDHKDPDPKVHRTYNILFCNGQYLVNNPNSYEPFNVLGLPTDNPKGDLSDVRTLTIPGKQNYGDVRTVYMFPKQNGDWKTEGGFGTVRPPPGHPTPDIYPPNERPVGETHRCRWLYVEAAGNPSCRVLATCEGFSQT